MRRPLTAAVLLAIVTGVVGCRDQASPIPAAKPVSLPSREFVASVLWLPDAAIIRDSGFLPVRIDNGRATYVDGTAMVSFEFRGECEFFASVVEARLSQLGWVPRATELLNPWVPLDVGTGCTRRHGGLIPTGPEGPVYEPFVEWRAEWEDPSGDIVAYRLGGMRQRFTGVASYKPREVVEWVRQSVEATRRDSEAERRKRGWGR